MSETILITGANRGIGLAVTKVLLKAGDKVFAACRKPEEATELSQLRKQYPSTLELVALEVSSDKSVENAYREVSKKIQTLDVLFNNAGISVQPYNAGLENLDLQQCRESFEVNTLGPLRAARAFLPLLRKSKNPRVINMTSGLASLSGKSESAFYAYGLSKAALNMLTRTEAFEFKKDGIVFVCLDPGWVQTDMGGPNAPLTAEASSTAIVKTLKGLTMEKTSQFIYNDGNELKW